jgi:hypothetical protein
MMVILSQRFAEIHLIHFAPSLTTVSVIVEPTFSH